MIRLMKPEDAFEAAAIEKQIITPPWTQADYLDALAKPFYLMLVAADEDDHVSGFCIASMAADEAEIVDVGVMPERQGRGLGSSLVGEMLTRLKEKGIHSVFLEVREHNAPAVCVYLKHGFEAAGKRKGFYHDPDEDAIIMKEEL